jgi:hypothetical protein
VRPALSSRPEAGEAEVAIVIEDRWQSRGVGKQLLFELAEDAKRQGVEAFFCMFLFENRVVPRLVDSVFSDARYTLKEGTRLARASLATLRPLHAPGVFDISHERLLIRIAWRGPRWTNQWAWGRDPVCRRGDLRRMGPGSGPRWGHCEGRTERAVR